MSSPQMTRMFGFFVCCARDGAGRARQIVRTASIVPEIRLRILLLHLFRPGVSSVEAPDRDCGSLASRAPRLVPEHDFPDDPLAALKIERTGLAASADFIPDAQLVRLAVSVNDV